MRKPVDTIEDRFDGRANALNLMRLVLAASVIVWHAYAFPLRQGLPDPAVRLLEQVGVDGFFAISGFLIVRSWQRHPEPRDFIAARAARILPGLWVCLVVTAFVIVPVAVAVADRAQPDLWAQVKYVVLNAGVFMGSLGIDGVPPPGGWLVWNASLWTLWWELMAYTVVLIAGGRGLLTTKGVVGTAVWCWLASLINMLLGSESSAANTHWNTAIPRLGLMFACGALLWMHRTRVPVSRTLLALSVLAVAASAYVPNYRLIAAPAVAYACVVTAIYLGRWAPLRLRHDISYGVYVYGAPVQLALIGTGHVGSWMSFTLATLAIVVPMATLSWLVVERPASRWMRKRRAALPVVSRAAT
jgi:peptidoglycan/LPS O-acetylase OafA/YrhL